MSGRALLEATDLVKRYRANGGLFGAARGARAVDGVSLAVRRGETFGLVGESGSGKSTTGRLVLGLERTDSGSVSFDGAPLPAIDSAAWRRQRARMQMVFQDPPGSLDPRMTIREQLEEPLVIHGMGNKGARRERVDALLDAVGLGRALAARYPRQISGGQCQRVVLARAIATSPDLLVCDEPLSALDVSTQAQIASLLKDLQARIGMALVFISHDLRAVRQLCDHVAVMYLGRIVEEGNSQDIFDRPLHPYTKALVAALPKFGDDDHARPSLLEGAPAPPNEATGCGFRSHCPIAAASCAGTVPVLRSLRAGRKVACGVVSDETLEAA